tara:strand:- start:4262 stop:5842 length:1581 start_codon:yes stop_codon:yes gene_type:complete
MKQVQLTLGLQALLTFKEMKNQHYTALGEFVDNSIQSYLDNKDDLKTIPNYKPSIHIDATSDEIVIEDNCAGISEENAVRAFDIGNPNSLGGIGTFGMGMKVSACWYSDNWKVETKAFNENVAKTYEVDIQKIVKSGEVKIGPKTEDAKGATPFTRITLIKPHRYPRTSEVTNVRKYLEDMYRWFINDNEIDIFYNGNKLKYKVPKVKELSEFPHEKDKKVIKWATEIPKLDLGDGYSARGFAYLRDKKANPQRGFGIFWQNKLIEGNWHSKWMPSHTDYDNKDEQEKYAIYAGENSAINQRLEGWIHISKNFRTTFTKDQVIWDGKEDVLIEKLKKYLQTATIYESDDTKKYNFINQAKKGRWLWKPDEDIADSGGDIFDQGSDSSGGVIDIPPQPDPEPDPEPQVDPGKFPSAKGENLQMRYDGTVWDITITKVANDVNQFVKKTDGPTGERHEESRRFEIQVNVAHPFVYQFFTSSGLESSTEGIVKLAVAIVIAGICSDESTKNSNAFFRHLDQILKADGFV